MRDADEIVRRNALRFIEQAQKSAEKEDRELELPDIAGRMAEIMGAKKKSVSKQLHRYLYEDHKWRIDYIEALGAALGRHVAEFVQPHAENKVPEATIAQALYTALGRRLTPEEGRALTRRIQRLLDHKPLYELSQDLLDVVLDADSQDSARLGAADVVKDSAAWDSKRTDLRGKRKGDKKS